MIPELPGVMVYGDTREAASQQARALANRVGWVDFTCDETRDCKTGS